MKYYSAVKKNKVLFHATTWVSLENIMLGKVTLEQKDKYCITPLTGNIQFRQIKAAKNKPKKEIVLRYRWTLVAKRMRW